MNSCNLVRSSLLFVNRSLFLQGPRSLSICKILQCAEQGDCYRRLKALHPCLSCAWPAVPARSHCGRMGAALLGIVPGHPSQPLRPRHADRSNQEIKEGGLCACVFEWTERQVRERGRRGKKKKKKKQPAPSGSCSTLIFGVVADLSLP